MRNRSPLKERKITVADDPVPQEPEPKCTPKHKIAFAKTHKTGSSTLQNIFFRYGVYHNLTFAMPPKSWMYSFKEPFDSSVVLQGPWKELSFDMFIFHSIWSYPEVKKVIPNAFFLTLLRDPVDCFESNYVYMGLENVFKMDINQYAKNKINPNVKRRPKAIIDKNQQLWDLGLSATEMEDVEKVKQKIEELDKQMDLVLIVEDFENSLVILQDKLCWPMKDMTSLKLNERMGKKKSNITEETRSIMKKWLWADYMLYDHFKNKLQMHKDEMGLDKLDAKRDLLTALNAKVKLDCVIEQAGNDRLRGEFKMALNIVLGYVIDEAKPWCTLFARSEPNFTKQLRDFQSMKVSAMKLRGF